MPKLDHTIINALMQQGRQMLHNQNTYSPIQRHPRLEIEIDDLGLTTCRIFAEPAASLTDLHPICTCLVAA